MNGFETGIRLGGIYAQALFELAERSKMLDSVKDDLDAVRNVSIEVRDFGVLMVSPYFSTEYKGQIIQKMFGGKLSDLTTNFLMVAVRHNRMMFLAQIIDKFNELREIGQGYRIVEVTVTEPMSKEEAKRFSTDIAGALKSKVKLQVSVNPSIIGGIIIRYGDKLVDNSLRGRLRQAVGTIMSSQKRQEKVDEV
jgi:F-type H+-transporting ATPase subunit delta